MGWRCACGRVAIEAVLAEWMRTVSSLPLILRQAVEMGLFSSAQLVRFCAMDNRPNVTRAVSRLLPATVRALMPCPRLLALPLPPRCVFGCLRFTACFNVHPAAQLPSNVCRS